MNRKEQAIEAGRKGFRDGKVITDNPYINASRRFMGLSAAWDAGFNKEKLIANKCK